jgi:hypothetical protein
MKNQLKKLALNQESLRQLTSEEEEPEFFKPSVLDTHCATCTRVLAE